MATFGFTGVHGSNDTVTEGFLRGIVATLADNNAEVSKLSCWVSNATGTAGLLRPFIYATSGGVPTTLKGVGPETTVPNGTTAGFFDFPFTGTITLATAGDYYIGLWAGTGGDITWNYEFDVSLPFYEEVTYHATNNPTSPLPSPTAFQNGYACLATYTVVAPSSAFDFDYSKLPKQVMVERP